MISSLHILADHPCSTTSNEYAYAEDFWTRTFSNKYVRDIRITVRPTVYSEDPTCPVKGSVALLEQFWESLFDAALCSADTFAIEHITIALDESVWVMEDGMPVCRPAAAPPLLGVEGTLSNSEIAQEAEKLMLSARSFEPDWAPLDSLRSLSVPDCMLGEHPELAGCFLRMLCPNAALPAAACTVTSARDAKLYIQQAKQAFLASIHGGATADSDDED
jgi:hypothetical protein